MSSLSALLGTISTTPTGPAPLATPPDSKGCLSPKKGNRLLSAGEAEAAARQDPSGDQTMLPSPIPRPGEGSARPTGPRSARGRPGAAAAPPLPPLRSVATPWPALDWTLAAGSDHDWSRGGDVRGRFQDGNSTPPAVAPLPGGAAAESGHERVRVGTPAPGEAVAGEWS